MTNYTKSTNFATKDTLPPGSALKIVRGTEIDTEFNSISTAIATKADIATPTFTTSITTPIVKSASSLVLQTNGTTTAVTIDTAQNVGVGVTPSPWGSNFKAIQVNALYGGSLSTSSAGNTFTHLSHGAYNSNTNWLYGATGFGVARYEMEGPSSGGTHKWFTAASGTAGNTITFTQAMTLDASGNLGVGTTSPTYRLAVVGATSDATPVANFRGYTTGTDGARTAIVRYSSSTDANWANARHDAYNHLWYGNGAEIARLTYDGSLLVGVTSSVATNNTEGFRVISGGVPTVQRGVDGGFSIFYNKANSATIGSISNSGGVATLYNTTSDYRLKTVIGSVADAGQRIDALQPIEYEWKSDGSRTRGFLAHQFQEVYASSVSGTKDAVDAEGKPVYQSMQASSSEVIADLVSEIQSLRQRLAAAGI
jgi:hypothetical protein